MAIRQAFISYSQKDRNYALKLAAIIKAQDVNVWIDYQNIKPGHFIAREIEKGLGNSNYFFLVLTPQAVQSKWVERELAMAFALARDGRLALVPTVFEKVDLPLEIRGSLYIDFATDFDAGQSQLTSFLKDELQPAASFYAPGVAPPTPNCERRLSGLQLPDLRHEISTRLDKSELRTVWFDTFLTKMDNDINPTSTAMISEELILRAKNRRIMDKLLKYLCRNRPDLANP